MGIARGVVDEGWLELNAISVLNEYRRRGVASAMVAKLIRWGEGRALPFLPRSVQRLPTPQSLSTSA